MKRFLMLLMMSLLLVACGNEETDSQDESDANASETDEEIAKMEEENEELKREKLEKENEELRKELEEKERKEEDSVKEEENSDDETSTNETSEDEKDVEATNSTVFHEDATNAAEHCIMTNLKECNDVSKESQIDAYYELVDRSVLTIPGYGEGEIDELVEASLHFKETNEWPEKESSSSYEIEGSERYEQIITEYLQRLAAHYSVDGYEDIWFYLKPGTPAYEKIAANKASGKYTDHETHQVDLMSMRDLKDGTVLLNVSRVYSHASSNGKRIANVNYIMAIENYEIIDFEQISDTEY